MATNLPDTRDTDLERPSKRAPILEAVLSGHRTT